MSQDRARHDPHARPGEEDDVDPQARQPERRQPVPLRARPQAGQPGDDGVNPDEPDEGESALIGDDDLGPLISAPPGRVPSTRTPVPAGPGR